MHVLEGMVVQTLVLQDCGIDNSGNYLKFVNTILLWSWYIELVHRLGNSAFLCVFLHEATSVSLLPGEVISACLF